MHRFNSREALAVSVTFAVLFSAAVLPVSVGWRISESSFDETRCYLPAITQMRANFPEVDLLRDSLSASPPGYTHLLAALSFVTGDSLPAHRAWHFALSLFGAIGLLWFVAIVARSTTLAVAALLPTVCSGYYLKNAGQLSTDNLALVLSVAVTALAMFGAASCRNAAFASLLGLCATYFRHVAAWTAAPLFAKGAVLWWTAERRAPHDRRRVVAWIIASVVVVLPLMVFVWAWGGLVPPRWARAHGSISLTPLVYCLSLCGLFAPFFLCSAALSRALKFNWRDVLWGALAGLAFFFISDTSPSYEAGRWGGPLWALADKLPHGEGRSFLFLPVAMLGAVCLAIAVRSLASRAPDQAFIWATAFSAWMLTGIPNRQVFHRYYEGPILAFFGLWLIAVLRGAGAPSPLARGILYALSAFLFLSGVYSLFTSVTGFVSPLAGR